jgi:hypothetical protein
MQSIQASLHVAALTFLVLTCASVAAPGPGAKVLIFGEAHDQPDQQRQVAEAVQQLAEAGQLAGVVLEMAEAPHSTAGLPRDASEQQVRDGLHWQGWPWDAYAQVVMNAVRAGVPVWGGNLPRSEMRTAMADATLDARVDAAAREALAQAVRTGHGAHPDRARPLDGGGGRKRSARCGVARDCGAAHRRTARLARPRRAPAPGRGGAGNRGTGCDLR